MARCVRRDEPVTLTPSRRLWCQPLRSIVMRGVRQTSRIGYERAAAIAGGNQWMQRLAHRRPVCASRALVGTFAGRRRRRDEYVPRERHHPSIEVGNCHDVDPRRVSRSSAVDRVVDTLVCLKELQPNRSPGGWPVPRRAPIHRNQLTSWFQSGLVKSTSFASLSQRTQTVLSHAAAPSGQPAGAIPVWPNIPLPNFDRSLGSCCVSADAHPR